MTREDLEAMTKKDLDAYAKETFDVDLDRRHTKESLIDEIMALQDGGDPQLGPVEDESENAPAPKGKTTLTIHNCGGMNPVILGVNGQTMEFPIGKRITVPTYAVPTLKAAGATLTEE